MTDSKKMAPEVLVYLQSLKKYFSTNSDAQKYFNLKGKEEEFFDIIGEFSQKNYEENGEPELSIFQFEQIKKKITKNQKDNAIEGGFMSFGDLGYTSLN